MVISKDHFILRSFDCMFIHNMALLEEYFATTAAAGVKHYQVEKLHVAFVLRICVS